jgi:hypothetical protein
MIALLEFSYGYRPVLCIIVMDRDARIGRAG